MLSITIPETDLFDNETSCFIHVKQTTLQLEHSLISLSKWESKWCKPFLSAKEKTPEETIDYIRCMTLTQNVDPMAYRAVTRDNMKAISSYIDAPMTATTFSGHDKPGPKEVITSELIYYWMIASEIPFECQKWHLNRLLTLIRVCGIKNAPGKKMSKNELLSRNAKLNQARRMASGTRG